jgi:hypothetical protein
MIKITMKEAIEILGSTTCFCGKSKPAKQVFCGKCYRSLPKELQTRLYLKIGNGFEEAVFDAQEILRAK